ncbi:MAG: translation elongation factor Ts [Chloroherpetonaceae bacterium]|nr:translation elongation factor Ts [Chloroherpetonaceae bacterium]MDW8019226.1 translation elongation factor Ts [Chloroherpetonaceae bacterium]MDW8464788.1 translation elongation factor Ts [Chloroherpetonaceae bacterium]
MAEISAKLVKELRDRTGAGMADCKKALEATEGDMEAAIKWLRERGAAAAAKRADREAKEGIIAVAQTDDKKAAAMVEVNCETDFVARSEAFVNFANEVAALALKYRTKTREALLELTMGGEFNTSVAKAAEIMVGKVGEKVEISRVALLEAQEGIVVAYTHPGAKLASLVHLSGLNGKDDPIAKDIAMQVAAAAPVALDRKSVPKEMIEREAEIYRQQALNEKKPEAVIERIVAGRIEKMYQDVALLEQPFIKDSSKTVTEVLKEASERLQATLTVHQFVRFQLGEKG